jgi:hypothetical protein
VYVPKDIPENEFEENWENTGMNPTPLSQLNKKHECTCNSREEVTEDGHFIVEDACKLHGTEGRRIKIKVSDAPKKFSRHHMDKVKDWWIYGDNKCRNIREILHRN